MERERKADVGERESSIWRKTEEERIEIQKTYVKR